MSVYATNIIDASVAEQTKGTLTNYGNHGALYTDNEFFEEEKNMDWRSTLLFNLLCWSQLTKLILRANIVPSWIQQYNE